MSDDKPVRTVKTVTVRLTVTQEDGRRFDELMDEIGRVIQEAGKLVVDWTWYRGD